MLECMLHPVLGGEKSQKPFQGKETFVPLPQACTVTASGLETWMALAVHGVHLVDR